MGDFDVVNFDDSKPDEPIEFPNISDKPIPFDDIDFSIDSKVSKTPLNLGAPNPAAQSNAPKTTVQKVVSKDHITGVKTFFTKLHSGSIPFLDEQITTWLKGNPGVVIKRTNTVTGNVISKKTEPNLIVTIWY